MRPRARLLVASLVAGILLQIGPVDPDARAVVRPRPAVDAVEQSDSRHAPEPARHAPKPAHLDAGSAPVDTGQPRAADSPAPTRTELGLPQRPLFAASSWDPPPAAPPPPRPAPPPAPPAPPRLPFTLEGWADDGGDIAILRRDERIYIVRVGDVIDGTYRVEAIERGAVTFMYLPLERRQTARLPT